MLTYLIIILDDTSISYCHYEVTKNERKLINLDDLRAGVLFAMKENLNVQFVYPDYKLPLEYESVIEAIDHVKIKPEGQSDSNTDVTVLTHWRDSVADCSDGNTCIIHASINDLAMFAKKVRILIAKATRLNIVLTDVELFTDDKINSYRELLCFLVDEVVSQYATGHQPQVNLVSDRLVLNSINECACGVTSLTLAPNGKFYLCPAFYYADEQNYIGDLVNGYEIKNQQLLQLDHAPLCRHCDAYQCRRCIWMNERLTGDLNTPSHQQCVIAHVERNATRLFRTKLEERGFMIQDCADIPELDYLDPIEMLRHQRR